MHGSAPRNPFDRGGSAYARFRPGYPPQLASWLAALAPSRQLAVDVGCGSGQLTRRLALRFAHVTGFDASADQIAHARAHARIDYRQAPAESLPLDDGVASLVTAAQAAHWFDLPAFYREARRIARPGAVLALVGYGAPVLEGALDARFQRFYRDEIGPWWPPERILVDTAYTTLDFPFPELIAPVMAIRCDWPLARFLGYLSTWSAVRNAREAGCASLLAAFADDITAAWGEPGLARPVRWPLHMRVGRLAPLRMPLSSSSGSCCG